MIYLASTSPRRLALLTQIAIVFEVIAAAIDETQGAMETPRSYVARMAREKAAAGRRSLGSRPDHPVLAADTIVVLDGNVLHKPSDCHEAKRLLHRLSGRDHEVLTALCLDAGYRCHEIVVTSTVSFKVLSASEIENYCQTGEPLGKAGGYAIQGRGALFIRHLVGSYSGVMGLPLYECGELLRTEGLS